MHTTTRPASGRGAAGHGGGTAGVGSQGPMSAAAVDGISTAVDDGSNNNNNSSTAAPPSTSGTGLLQVSQQQQRSCVISNSNKEPLLSSSDTDDCDAPDKLVIDLDGGTAGVVPSCSADQQSSVAGASVDTGVKSGAAPLSASSSNPTTSCRNNSSTTSDLVGSKSSRGGGTMGPVDGPKSGSSSGSHRLPLSAAASLGPSKTTLPGTEMSSAAVVDGIPPPKGLKMKIKCSQVAGAGVPARHEVSHFHPLVVGSSVSNSAAAVASPLSSSSASSSTANSSNDSSLVRSDPVASVAASTSSHSLSSTRPVSGSHRKDHRQAAKDRGAAAVKDRSATSAGGDHHQTAVTSSSCGSSSSGSVITTTGSSWLGLCSVDDVKPVVDGILDKDCSVSVTSSSANSSSTALLFQHNDPYEFNVRTEDSVGRPSKKIKMEKAELACSPAPPPPASCDLPPPPTSSPAASYVAAATDDDICLNSTAAAAASGCAQQQSSICAAAPAETRDAAVDACHVGVVTDPDCLGPCEPGTTVTLEGIVWNETENGLLVVNVTWRGKTYVGTLMDATRHHWAPPRFATESPTSDLDGRTPKGRGKRGRTCATALRSSDFNGSDRKLRSNRCAAGNSGKSSGGSGSPVRLESGGTLPAKRPRVGGESGCGSASNSDASSRGNSKSNRSDSRMSDGGGTDATSSVAAPDTLIECLAPNCSKKFRQLSALRYHQSRAHPNMTLTTDEFDADDTDRYATTGKSSTGNADMRFKTSVKMDNDDTESMSDGSDGWKLITNGQSELNDSKNAASSRHNGIDSNGGSSNGIGDAQKPEKKCKSSDHRAKSKQPSAATASVTAGIMETTEAPSSPGGGGGQKVGCIKVTTTDENSGGQTNGRDRTKHKKKDRDRHRDKERLVVERIKESTEMMAVDGDVVSGALISGVETDVSHPVESYSADSSTRITSRPFEYDVACVVEDHSLKGTVGVAADCGLPTVKFVPAMSHGNKPQAVDGNSSSSVLHNGEAPFSIPTSVVMATELNPQTNAVATPTKKSKSTPTKHPVDLDNPHSPAYSDISDANETAPMLEKEATTSGPVTEEDELADSCGGGGSSAGDRHPLSVHLPDSYHGSFGGPGSSTLYGQPPCLTPAVVPLDGPQGPQKQLSTAGGVGIAKSDKQDSLRLSVVDDRHGSGSSSNAITVLRPPPPRDIVRSGTTDGMSEMADRNVMPNVMQQPRPSSGSRTYSSGDVLRSPHSPVVPPPAPMMPPANMYMAYPYLGAGGFPGFDAALLMQHPDYRAHYERLIQQEVTRRHDIPPAAISRTDDRMPPDLKGFPPMPRSNDTDRRAGATLPPPSKADIIHTAGSLPTPPTLIPDRSLGLSFEDQDGHGMKLKGSDRREDPQRVFMHQQYAPAAGDRQRRHEEPLVGKDGSGGKPSAVVAPQARDRNPIGAGSSKMRVDESSRPSQTQQDQNRGSKSSQKGGGGGIASHSDMQSRSSRDPGPDRANARDDKGMQSAGRSSGLAFKPKEEASVVQPPIASSALPLPVSYSPTPYYPYLPGAPQYAGAPLPFDPSTIYSNMNMNPIIGFAGANPGGFLHPAQMGYLQSAGAPTSDIAVMMPPPPGIPLASPSDGKPRDLTPRGGFYPSDGGQGSTTTPVHKIHELKEVAKGTGIGGQPEAMAGGSALSSASRDAGRPESRGGPSVSSGPKDHERGSPPMQRHLHTHHHMHMLGPPFIGFPGDTAMMASSQATTAPPIQRPYLGK